MLKTHELENIAVELNSFLKIPKPIVLSYRECKQANAFYSPSSGSIVMCYELIDSLYETFEKDGLKGDELDRSVGNAVGFAFYHELGHALIDVLKLPITGREEDAVDQLATFLVAGGADEEETTALDGVIAFLLMAKMRRANRQSSGISTRSANSDFTTSSVRSTAAVHKNTKASSPKAYCHRRVSSAATLSGSRSKTLGRGCSRHTSG